MKRIAPGLVIALLFLATSSFTLDDFGQTWDEVETLAASLLNIGVIKAIATGQPPQPWTFHELPGYYFVVDLIRGAFVWATSNRLRLMDSVLSLHFVNVVFSALSVFLFYLLARNVSGRGRVGLFATIALVFLPQFLAHSQNNPKDLPGLLLYVLTIYTFTRPAAGGSRRDLLASGVVLGLALTTSVSSIFLVPIVGLWQAWTRSTLEWKQYLLILAVATITAFACWPWLWTDPVGHLAWAARHILARFNLDSVKVLYLGRVYEAWDVPWHYSLVSLLAVTPVLYMVLALCAVGADRSLVERSAPSPRNAALLGALWCAIPIAAEARGPMHYDGARHLLMTAPALCLLAAVGLDFVLQRLEQASAAPLVRTWPSIVPTICAVAALLYTSTDVIRVHPYYSSYLNEIVRAWLPRNAEDVFEVEYWGQTHKEGAEWLNAHAEPEADIYVGLDSAAADRYLRRKPLKLDERTSEKFEDRTRPAYLMVMTRKAMYSPAIEHVVRTYDPVMVIQRQHGTLLKVFSNRQLQPR